VFTFPLTQDLHRNVAQRQQNEIHSSKFAQSKIESLIFVSPANQHQDATMDYIQPRSLLLQDSTSWNRSLVSCPRIKRQAPHPLQSVPVNLLQV
ncbi:unnamed protein product, partial [Prunus brigantina]